MSAKCLNLIRLYRHIIPPSSLEEVAAALVSFDSLGIADDVYVVSGDVNEIVFRLCLVPGVTESSFQFYSFSAFEGKQGRIEHIFRKLARAHLRHELGLLGLETPASLRDDEQ